MSSDPAREGSHLSRRNFIRTGGAAAAAAGFAVQGAGAASAQAVPAAGGAGTRPATPLAVFSLQSLYGQDLSDSGQAAQVYDQMRLVFTLQGIVNRREPLLYVDFSSANDFFDGNPDEYWLDKLRQPGGFLAGRPVRTITSLDELVRAFRHQLRGAVVWDPAVPATANVATTVAGVEDVVAIRYDPSPGSAYSSYVTAGPERADLRLPALVSLVRPGGASLFTGQGAIPGTGLASTGSAKCDAYLWAKVRYLDSGRCDPTRLGYYLDAYWLTAPAVGGIAAACVANHDFLVSGRGFAFDLSPWGDEAPPDDPGQAPGTDLATFTAILASANKQARGRMVAIHGFTPWQYKYTNASLPAAGAHDPVGTEWEGVALCSAYNAYLDADAPGIGSMTNASVYAHTPLAGRYPQPDPPTVPELMRLGYVNPDGSVAARRFVMFYVGDYDSASWIYNTLPGAWDDPNRGAVPLNWAFNPELSDRIAPAFLYTRATRSANDYFVAGDSGAGYVNPSALEAPRSSGLPSGLAAWQRHCSRYYRLWDISVTGFIIDGISPVMDARAQQAYAQFSPDGWAEQASASLGIAGTSPFVRSQDISGTAPQAAASVEGLLSGDTSGAALGPEFHSLRAILQTPTWYKQLVDQVHADLPGAGVEFVDALTFYALVRQYLEDQVIASVDGSLALVVAGTSTPVTINLTSYAATPLSGTVSLQLPGGWAQSGAAPFTLDAGATTTVSVGVTAPADAPLGQSQIVSALVTVSGQSRSYQFQAVTASSATGTVTVSTVLGDTNADDNLSQLEVPGDGVTQPVTAAGQSGRQLVQVVANDLNMYFAVAQGVAFDGNFSATFTIVYLDQGTGPWALQYDSNNESALLDGAYTTAATVTNADTGQWQTLTVSVSDARFDHRENGGADFRINTSLPLIVHSASVEISGPGVNPSA